MNKQFCVLVVLLVSASAFTIHQNEDPNDDRVKIDFFYESLCPYCQQYITGSLKTAASTKVSLPTFRISGKYVTSTSTPTGIPREPKMDLRGISPASMESGSVKETSLKPAQSSSTQMISTPKLYPSSSVWSKIPTIGTPRGRSVPNKQA